MLEFAAGETIVVPGFVAECPECLGDILLDVIDYGVDDGRVYLGGYVIDCAHSNGLHDCWENIDSGSIVDELYSSVQAWLDRSVRIRIGADGRNLSPVASQYSDQELMDLWVNKRPIPIRGQ